MKRRPWDRYLSLALRVAGLIESKAKVEGRDLTNEERQAVGRILVPGLARRHGGSMAMADRLRIPWRKPEAVGAAADKV